MAVRQLTIDIPEPDNGSCSPECSLLVRDEHGVCCLLGLRTFAPVLGEYAPGPKCPQYQGIWTAVPVIPEEQHRATSNRKSKE